MTHHGTVEVFSLLIQTNDCGIKTSKVCVSVCDEIFRSSITNVIDFVMNATLSQLLTDFEQTLCHIITCYETDLFRFECTSYVYREMKNQCALLVHDNIYLIMFSD
jgi:hypothetical protein